jgi:hypothetical protein
MLTTGRAEEATLRARFTVTACSMRSRAPGRPSWLVGRVSRQPVRVGQATRHVSRAKLFGAVAGPQQAKRALCTWAELGFGLEAVSKLKSLFYFHFSFKLNLNFKNLYLNIQGSQNYEISSVGFIIF